MSDAATELSLSKKVPSGDIMLQIKLHYGEERVAYVQVNDDMSLKCSIDPQVSERIVCTGRDGSPLYLSPEIEP